MEPFLQELRELFEKYGLMVAPEYNSQPSFHDRLVVVKLDDHGRKYLDRMEAIRLDEEPAWKAGRG